ncbi:Retrovirus-related Pol polyprotein from transposon [Trichinella patagoniensis]|uniref:RNA-directed DNA polymerase n=1 Tax=Trichinella patagoniensis TaxID=990121 RepID=A0A0V0Z4V3_9BILA|nr:Retrovirus-related Pol polyprotein from transposon [Trichinella patagoniensis]
MQRPGDLPAADGERVEGVDIQGLLGLFRRHYCLRAHGRGTSGTTGQGAPPLAVHEAEDQAREMPADASKCTLPVPCRNTTRYRDRPGKNSGGARVAQTPVRKRSPAVHGPRFVLSTVCQELCQYRGSSPYADQERLESALYSPPILSHPHFDRPFLLDVDASEDALGAVLSQMNHQGLPVVVAYASRSLSQPEKKYCATRREMLALVWATRRFRPYLYGRTFTARTDHNALRWLRNFREPEGQVARWLERLAEYEFECGAMIPTADAQVAAMTLGPTGRIQEWQEADPELRQIREWLEKRDWPQEPPAGSHMFRSLWSQRDWLTLRDGILCRAWEAPDREEEKMLQVVPRRNIPEVLRAVHNHPTGGHLGVAKTLGRVRQRFYWPPGGLIRRLNRVAATVITE